MTLREPKAVRDDLAAAYRARTGVEPPEFVVTHEAKRTTLTASVRVEFEDDADGHAKAIADVLDYFAMARGKAEEMADAGAGGKGRP